MIFTIMIIFFILNIIVLIMFTENYNGIYDKWLRDWGNSYEFFGGPDDIIFVAGFSPFPFLNILMFCYIFSKYHKYSKEK